ncbi:MAG: SRPBCC family protein [Microthrixaceae bacterium]
MSEVVRTRLVSAPGERVWAALADYAAISAWAANVDHSSLTTRAVDGTQAGLGAVRRIQTGRRVILERVVLWGEPTELAYSLEGLPPVVRSARNRWLLKPVGPNVTEVSLTTTLDCGPRPPQQLIARLVARRLAAESDTLLAGLASSLEETTHV